MREILQSQKQAHWYPHLKRSDANVYGTIYGSLFGHVLCGLCYRSALRPHLPLMVLLIHCKDFLVLTNPVITVKNPLTHFGIPCRVTDSDSDSDSERTASPNRSGVNLPRILGFGAGQCLWEFTVKGLAARLRSGA